ncbi:MAG: hypothetical protein GF329_16480 [Candidatus Lokiarchaeota archaeon]|nr:hypothetical protein [Candidatus Lokiarchaeota archaeon]
MAEKEEKKEKLIYYLCNKLPRKKLDKEIKNFIKETPELEVLRAKILESMEYIEAYAATGQVRLMEQPLKDIDNLLRNYGLYLPEFLKNELLKIGLLNGIPREFEELKLAMENRSGIGVAKHWKIFQTYIEQFSLIFKEGDLNEGEKMVLSRWIDEYNRLKEVISDPFHIYRQD